MKRIRLHRVNARHVVPKSFDIVSTAVLGRRQLAIRHYHRLRNAEEERTLSPQRLTYYRDNWYLDAWCHMRQGIRSFSLDTIVESRLLDEPAIDIPDADLDAIFMPGYGIFSGADVQWAVLRFTPEKARWVSRERWHPQQTSAYDPDGHYILRLPYSDDRELVMDIMRHMPEVSVMGPESLRERVRRVLKEALRGVERKR